MDVVHLVLRYGPGAAVEVISAHEELADAEHEAAQATVTRVQSLAVTPSTRRQPIAGIPSSSTGSTAAGPSG